MIMIISILYISGTGVNIQYQLALARDVCAGHNKYPVMINAVRRWLPGIG
jgi:hypothetical protein